MTHSNPQSMSDFPLNQFSRLLDAVMFAETDNMRWLRLAAEKLERDRATDTKEMDRG